MPLTWAMRDHFAQYATTALTTDMRFASTNSHIHVGDGSGAFSAADNKLLTLKHATTGTVSSSKRVSSMEANYPQYAAGAGATPPTLTFRSLFGNDDAVFEWYEWGVRNSSATATSTSNGVFFNRKLESPSLGVKTNLQSWQITATLSVTT